MNMARAETDIDAHWMGQALAAAREAQQCGEVPVGTCIVIDETLISLAGNRTRAWRDQGAAGGSARSGSAALIALAGSCL